MIKKEIKWLSYYLHVVFKKFKNGSLKRNFLQALPFWVASLISGFVAVAYTTLFNTAENAFYSLKSWSPVSVLFVTPITFCVAFLIVNIFAPNAGGSGIPQVMASIELSNKRHGGIIDQLLNLRVLVTKIFSSIMMVQGGAPVGREGPTVQISASIFRLVNKVIPNSWPKLSLQNFIITGAAAGLAAAFNTPLGGIVFGIEELAKVHIRYFRTALFTAVIVAGITAQAILGSYLYLGYPEIVAGGVIIFLAIGVVSLAAAFGSTAMCKMAIWFYRQKKNFSFARNLTFAFLAGLAIAIVGYFLNENIFGSGKELMSGLLFRGEKFTSFDTVLFRIAGSALCFNAGGAGGIFAPSLAAGAAVGSYVGHLLHYSGNGANILILCGMVAFLTGVTRTPFTSTILVLEMTDRHGVIFYLIFAALIAYVVSLSFERRSLYDYLKEEILRTEKMRTDSGREVRQ